MRGRHEAAYAPGVITRLGAMAVFAVAMPFVAGACGSESGAADTLPPMITTTTTTTLLVTTTTTVSLYTVQSGDTLGKIARKFGVDQATLMLANGISDPDHIEAGAVLKIPPPTVTTTTLVASVTTSTTTG